MPKKKATQTPAMHVRALQVKNVKKIREVEITDAGEVVVVAGQNAQGKSSLLDSIMYCLAGAKTIPARPMRDGSEEAEITATLGDEEEPQQYRIQRRWTKSGNTSVKIYTQTRTGDWATVERPQKVLDNLISHVSFDPLAFVNMKPRAQVELLRVVTGLDFSELDAQRKDLYEQRTLLNREAEAMSHEVLGMPHYPDAPAQRPDPAALLQELDESQQHNHRVAGLENEAQECARLVEQDEQALALLKEEVLSVEARVKARKKAAKQAREKADAAELIDIASIQERIAQVSEVNEQISANERQHKRGEELKAKRSAAGKLTREIEAIDEKKAAILADTDLPVDGLEFGEEGVTFNGSPFEQASQAEKLRVSLAIGFARAPHVKVVTIRDASLLDSNSLKLVREETRRAGGQVWLERVGDDDDADIIMEDGVVKGASEPAQADLEV